MRLFSKKHRGLTNLTDVILTMRAMTWLRFASGCRHRSQSFRMAMTRQADDTRLGGSSVNAWSMAQYVIRFSVVRLWRQENLIIKWLQESVYTGTLDTFHNSRCYLKLSYRSLACTTAGTSLKSSSSKSRDTKYLWFYMPSVDNVNSQIDEK